MKKYFSGHMLSIAACIAPVAIIGGGYAADAFMGARGMIFWICFAVAVAAAIILLATDVNAYGKGLELAERGREQAARGREQAERLKTERDILKAKVSDMQQRLDFAIKRKLIAEQELSDAKKAAEAATEQISVTDNEEQQVSIVRVKEDFCGVPYETFRNTVGGWAADSLVPVFELQRSYASAEDKTGVKNLDIISNSLDSIIYLAHLDKTDAALDIKECNIGMLVKECLKKHAAMLASKKIGTLRKGLELSTKTDHRWLSFAISQILLNAINHTNDFGKIAVTGRRAEDGIYVVIEDSGLGSDSEELLRLFEPGFITAEEKRMHKNPTGMSLFMAKHAIEHIGGEIIAESVYGRGTRIHIKLPVC